MGLKLGKKTTATATADHAEEKTEDKTEEKGGEPNAADALKKTGAKKESASRPSWLNRGSQAQEQLAQERARIEAEKLQRSSMFRFWVNEGDDAIIVFLDGDLISDGGKYDGNLDFYSFREHTVQVGKRWDNFICCDENNEPCPLCDGGDKPAVVAPFTVIDTRKIQGRSKVYENERKLFMAKSGTLATLQKMAEKRGGLRGCVFEVTRSGDKSPRVGTNFDFEGKLTEEQLADHFGKDNIAPADYEKEIPYRTPAQIAELTGRVIASAVGSQKAATTDVPF